MKPNDNAGKLFFASLAIKAADSIGKNTQSTLVADARDYNELMDEYSLH